MKFQRLKVLEITTKIFSIEVIIFFTRANLQSLVTLAECGIVVVISVVRR